ncbi:MAG: adenylyltransferase [Acidobacteriaceae bacterium]|nr:adenylyltransferase [Acidobacteriaceae bacterium]
MHIFCKLDEVPAEYGSTVVSVGNFDGVHCAHKKVLQEVVRRAKELKAKSMVVTFDPHPTRILRPEMAPKLLTPLPAKLRLLAETGLDATLVLPFSRDLSLTKPQDFAKTILRDRLRALEVHEGANFHFGHKAEGNVGKLVEFGAEFGFAVRVYPELKIRGQVVSSSNIRQLLRDGDVTNTRHLLGRVFSISAPPGRGRGYGHKYTVPTINLARYDEMVPGNGVYITRAKIDSNVFDSVTNIGNRPTFGEESFAIETHLLNFHEIDVTAETTVELSFLKWLRPEMKWPDVDSLRAQISKDVHRARRYFHLQHLLTKQTPALT